MADNPSKKSLATDPLWDNLARYLYKRDEDANDLLNQLNLGEYPKVCVNLQTDVR